MAFRINARVSIGGLLFFGTVTSLFAKIGAPSVLLVAIPNNFTTRSRPSSRNHGANAHYADACLEDDRFACKLALRELTL